jgi:large subunit ribosomal protein L5
MTQRLKKIYQTEIAPQLLEEFQYKNSYQIPIIKKIVLNRGIGNASGNSKQFDIFINELNALAGQKCVITKSKKAIAGFQLRENTAVGLSVVLRGDRMYAFLDRLIHLAFPRIRDFQGILPTSFDGKGNFSFGVCEQLMFPELEYENVEQLRGMDISIITTSKTNKEGLRLLKLLGMPFQ